MSHAGASASSASATAYSPGSIHALNRVDVSVILPTYNERDNICDLVDAIRTHLNEGPWRYELLVVDDDSPDGTAAVVRTRYGMIDHTDAGGAAALDDDGMGAVRLIVRTTNRGLAASVWEGLVRSRGETLVVMDTDFNHDPAMIPQMVDLLRYYDLVIGSRFVMRGGMEDARRYQLSYAYNMFIRVLFQTQIQDHLSGFFAVRRGRISQLNPEATRIFYGYGDYFIRLLLVAWRRDWKILEVPVYYILRRHGIEQDRLLAHLPRLHFSRTSTPVVWAVNELIMAHRRAYGLTLLVGLLLTIYTFSHSSKFHVVDEVSLFAVTESIGLRGAVDTNAIAWTQWVNSPGEVLGAFGPEGDVYSKKGVGPALAALPWYLWLAPGGAVQYRGGAVAVDAAVERLRDCVDRGAGVAGCGSAWLR